MRNNLKYIIDGEIVEATKSQSDAHTVRLANDRFEQLIKSPELLRSNKNEPIDWFCWAVVGFIALALFNGFFN